MKLSNNLIGVCSLAGQFNKDLEEYYASDMLVYGMYTTQEGRRVDPLKIRGLHYDSYLIDDIGERDD